MRRVGRAAVAAVFLAGCATTGAGAEPPGAPAVRDAPVEGLLSSALSIMQSTRDPDEAARALVPLVHASLLDASGAALSADVRAFSFKKAHASAPLYQVPVQITRVRPSAVTAIGFGPTAERGRTVDYFVAKRQGVPGLPAPVTVFFPASGAPPKISYLGSL